MVEASGGGWLGLTRTDFSVPWNLNAGLDLEFVDLTRAEVLTALEQTRRRGVRGGRVHDFLHAVAAEKSGAAQLLTTDEHDFESLSDHLRVEQV